MNGKRHSFAEIERVVREYERSGLTRRQFSDAHGLKIYTLDAWRQRVLRSSGDGKIVPVELVSDHEPNPIPVRPKSTTKPSMTMRVVLNNGLRVEVEPEFDGVQLRRLIESLDESREHR